MKKNKLAGKFSVVSFLIGTYLFFWSIVHTAQFLSGNLTHYFIFFCITTASLVIVELLIGRPKKDALPILLLALSLIATFYSFSNTLYYPDNWNEQAIFLQRSMQIIAVICGVSSLLLPSLTLIPCLYVIQSKIMLQQVTGISFLSKTDYLPVIELGLYGSCLLVGLYLVQALTKKKQQNIYNYALVSMIAVHLSNYFHSAGAKLFLNGGPVSWIFENPTHVLALGAVDKHFAPISHWPQVSFAVVSFMAATVVLGNLTTVVTQAVSIVAIQKRVSLIYLTLIYDVLHTLIFITTGIFFWKWVIFNLFVVVVLKKYPYNLTRAQQLYGSAAIFCAPALFTVVFLGWYDTFYYNDIYFTAHTYDKKSIRVPSNYFLGNSVTFMQARFPYIEGANLFPVGTMGTTTNYDVLIKSRDCQQESLRIIEKGDQAYMRSLIQRHHQIVVNNLNQRGRIHYDWFPHHGWSNPFAFDEFRELDKRQIEFYRYHNDAFCYQFTDDGYSVKPISQKSIKIELPK